VANNRMVLACTECVNNPATTPEDCFFYLLKYYPSTGWYVVRGEEQLPQFAAELNVWLDKHKHGSLLGEYLLLLPERVLSERAQDQVVFLEALQNAAAALRSKEEKKKGKES
jgi:hypothetical protein